MYDVYLRGWKHIDNMIQPYHATFVSGDAYFDVTLRLLLQQVAHTANVKCKQIKSPIILSIYKLLHREI